MIHEFSRLPSAMRKGGTSWTILEQPPVMASDQFCKIDAPQSARHDGVIANPQMTRQSSVIRNTTESADLAIVTDVTIGEKIPRLPTRVCRRLFVLRLTVQNSRKVFPSPIPR